MKRLKIFEAWDEAWDEAITKKTLEVVDNAMKKLYMSFEEACAFMDITPAQYETYMQVVKTLEKNGNADE